MNLENFFTLFVLILLIVSVVFAVLFFFADTWLDLVKWGSGAVGLYLLASFIQKSRNQ